MATCSEDYQSASSKLNISKKLSIAGIIIGVIIMIMYLFLQFTGIYDFNSEFGGAQEDNYDYYG